MARAKGRLDDHDPGLSSTDQRGRRTSLGRAAGLQPGLRKLIQIAGLALFDLGVLDPSEALLEPISTAIHSLGDAGESEQDPCELR